MPELNWDNFNPYDPGQRAVIREYLESEDTDRIDGLLEFMKLRENGETMAKWTRQLSNAPDGSLIQMGPQMKDNFYALSTFIPELLDVIAGMLELLSKHEDQEKGRILELLNRLDETSS